MMKTTKQNSDILITQTETDLKCSVEILVSIAAVKTFRYTENNNKDNHVGALEHRTQTCQSQE